MWCKTKPCPITTYWNSTVKKCSTSHICSASPSAPTSNNNHANATANAPASTQWGEKSSSEPVIGVLLLRKPKSLGRFDTFTGVLTNQRFIFAQMTSEMLKDAAMQAREQAKAEGKGFWGQWSDQLKASLDYTKKYLTMQPQAILAETPGNFAVNNEAIKEIKVNLKHLGNQDNRHELEIEIHSNAGKYEYRMDEDSYFTDLLKKIYGDKVKMPFGYFSKTIHIGF
jgi:hypothetical protein